MSTTRSIRWPLAVAGLFLFVSTAVAQFETPLYFNMGGPAFTDSLGRNWLGDLGAGADPNNIRPNDAGGFNVIGGWCGAASADALAALGFGPGDGLPLQSIRWDTGNDGIDYTLEIPLSEGKYDIDLYFCEAGANSNRHFKIDIQGVTTFADVRCLNFTASAASHVA